MTQHNDPHNNNDDPQAQAQAQLQAQLEAQAQGQKEHQGQGQGQGQGQSQGQTSASYLDSSSWNANGNLNGNGNGNGNLNGNGNENENANCNANGNENISENVNQNVNENITAVCVDVHVGLDLSWLQNICPSDNDLIDLKGVSATDSVVMPDVVTQNVDHGNAINFDQVNNLADQDYIGSASTYYAAGDTGGCCFECCPTEAPAFSMSASAAGGAVSADISNCVGSGDGGAASATVSANAAVTQEAFTIHITQGANIQFNSVDMHVNAGDLHH